MSAGSAVGCAVDEDPHLLDRLADDSWRRGAGDRPGDWAAGGAAALTARAGCAAPARARQVAADDAGEQDAAHQNLWRTLKSSANVRSPFCVTTQPTRSF